MKTNYKGHQFEGTTAEFIDFMKLVDSGIMGKSTPTPSGKNAPKRVTLTDEERAEKTKAKNDAWKEQKKEYASQFTETEKAEYIKYKAFGRVLKDAYTLASAQLVNSTLKGDDRKTEWKKQYELYINELCEKRQINRVESEKIYQIYKARKTK